MIEALGATIAKGTEVAAGTTEISKIAEAGKSTIDIGKRIEISAKTLDTKAPDVDIAKRISPKGEFAEAYNQAKELTGSQVKELIDKGMSPKIVDDCKYQDGIYKLKTINEKLENTVQPETGVKYTRKVVDLAGSMIEGVFPNFESVFTAQLPVDKLIAKDYVQFSECVTQLQKAIENSPSLRAQFNERQLKQIASGRNPDGYTWHHNEEVGKMELVKREVHDLSKHTGGKSVWGGGSNARQ